MSLEGRVALVTGASRGVGEYVARSLAKAGAKVAVAARSEEATDPRLPGTIHTVSEQIRRDGGEALPVRMDVRNPESIVEGIQKTVDGLGGLDIVVNNAAVLVPGTVETVLDRHLDLMWQIDLRGPLLVIKHALPHLRKAGRGHIINVSSRAGVFPGPGPYPEGRTGSSDGPFYGMVKAGLERFSQALAQDLQSANISVNVLSPQGRIKTPGNIFARNDRDNPDLDFEEAWEMGKGTVWICEQGVEFTGHILFDQDFAREKGL